MNENFEKVRFDEIENNIKRTLEVNNICYTDDIKNKLEIYYNFLVEYNKNVNLTSITEKCDVYEKHFLDSILGVEYFGLNATVADIGTGAGFPGVVLKIVRPDLKVYLIDSLQKRVDFLNMLIKKLNLSNIYALHYRAEDNQLKEKHLNSFDYVTARAVAKLNTLVEYCLPYVKVGGKFVAYKSVEANLEAKECSGAIKLLGGGKCELYTKQLNDDTNRCFVIIDKIKQTSSKYPRGQNKPRLAPLK